MRAGIVSSWNEPFLLLDPNRVKKVDCIPVGAEIVIGAFEGKTGPSRVSNLRHDVENAGPVALVLSLIARRTSQETI